MKIHSFITPIYLQKIGKMKHFEFEFVPLGLLIILAILDMF